MWETTGDAAALADAETRIGALTTTVVDADFDWGNVKNLGLFTYLLSQRSGRDAAIVDRVRSSALAAADAVVAEHDGSGYGRGVRRFYWGSNGSVARTAMLLDLAHGLTSDAKYLDVAIDQLGYLFGRNHYNRSHVTGLGVAPPLTPHHRPSASDAVSEPYPGLLVGGGTTAINWVDDQDLYMLNEVAVNWNGALVYALALFLPATAPPPAVVDAAGGMSADASSDEADGQPGDGGIGGPPRGGGGCGCGIAEPGAHFWVGLGLSVVMLAIALSGRRRTRRHAS
jgi:endoglucanase